jgi:hypothetical protein
MAKITLEIKNCSECPHFRTENPWSSDGWDRMVDWVCHKTSSPRKIEGSVEWHEESKIRVPDWCPILIKED